MRVVVVYNPKSGSSLSAKELRQKFSDHHITIERLIPLQKNINRTLASSIKLGRTIAVIGGDGTISSIAGRITGTRAVLAPLPGGTLNHFTKDLGIPQDLDDALVRLRTAKIQNIDVGLVNETIFVNNSSFGIYPASLRFREQLEDSIGKWPAAIVGIIRALVRFKVYSVTINDRTLRTPFVFVGNNQYNLHDIGPMNRTSIHRGVLGVAIVRSASRVHTVWVGLRVLLGMGDILKEFETFKTDGITIESKHREIHVSHDGEVTTMTLPLRFEILKKSLRVL